jgi:transcriptional regulator with XRE-family HTH domain
VSTKYLKALSKHIDKLRQDRSWSFQQMANACEMDKAQVYKICTDSVDLRVSSIEKLAKGFGITSSELLNF